jgi:hypothetical protein
MTNDPDKQMVVRQERKIFTDETVITIWTQTTTVMRAKEEENPSRHGGSAPHEKKKRVKLSFTEMEEEEAKMFRSNGTGGGRRRNVDCRATSRRQETSHARLANVGASSRYSACLVGFGLAVICKRWVQPLKNGTLGNVTSVNASWKPLQRRVTLVSTPWISNDPPARSSASLAMHSRNTHHETTTPR